MSATSVLDVMAVRATGDPAQAVVRVPADVSVAERIDGDVLVVGGGTGGVAAALAAARAMAAGSARRRVVLLEETDWIGGQLTAQGVSALDEHEHIERFGGTRSYYALREAVRDHYRRLSSVLAREAHPNPGHCWVTRLAFEPRVALDVLRAMAAPHVDAGRLRILTRTKAVRAETAGARITAVLALHLDERRWMRITPGLVIDATELGDLLPLAGADAVVGAEARAETGEPHAQPVEGKPQCVQSFTYTFVVENTGPGGTHTLAIRPPSASLALPAGDYDYELRGPQYRHTQRPDQWGRLTCRRFRRYDLDLVIAPVGSYPTNCNLGDE